MTTKASLAVAGVFFVAVATSAQPRTIGTAPNASGGQIVLTNEPCFLKGSKAGERTLFTRSSDGATVFGCYMVIDPYVVAVYRDGTAFTYEPGWFTVVPNDGAKVVPVKGL